MKHIKFNISAPVTLPTDTKNKIKISLHLAYESHLDNLYENGIYAIPSAALVDEIVCPIKIEMEKSDRPHIHFDK